MLHVTSMHCVAKGALHIMAALTELVINRRNTSRYSSELPI